MRLREGAVSWREIDGDVVLLDEQSWTYVHLNASAAVLWRSLAAGTGDADALLADLLKEFPDAPADQARADVDAFIDDLRGRGYLDA